jgi:hypothetical protein
VVVLTIPDALREAEGIATAELSLPKLSLIFNVGPLVVPPVQVTVGVTKETAVATPEELI